MIELGHFLPGGELLKDEKGVSETYTGMIEVGNRRLHAYVKFLPDRELANELLGSVLARKSGLQVPDAFLVNVRREDYPASPRFQVPGVITIPAFATGAMNHKSFNRTATLQSPEAKKQFVSLWVEWPEVLGFDDWIANTDRHGGNFLIGGPGQVWLIDHGHSFTGPNWQIANLQPQCQINSRLWGDVLQANVTHEAKQRAVPRVAKAAAKFHNIDADEAVEIAHIKTYLTAPENQALVAFLKQRCGSVSQRISALLGLPLLPMKEVPQ